MKEAIRKQLEGSISVDTDSKVTPITRKAIKTVDASQWPDLGLTELYEELAILESRRIHLYEIGQPTIAKQVEIGIARLQLIIKSKSDGLPRLM